jgi:hypothetical protein
MLRLILITVILSILSVVAYGLIQYGVSKERAEWRWSELKAVEAAREDEKRKQKRLNDVIQTQYDEIKGNRDSLLNDYNELLSRQSRSEMPSDTGSTCQNGDGRSLYAEDAIFLRREASRADEFRSALKACYAAYDSLSVD